MKPINSSGTKLSLGKALLFCLICIIVTAAVTVGIMYGKFGGRDQYKAAQKYIEVQNVIEDKYIGEYDENSIIDSAASAMVESLGDRWSYYMTADQYTAYKLHTSNEYEGIGVTLSKDEKSGGFEIISVIEDTPAETAGLEAGQIIVAVDDEDVTDMTIDELREVITSKVNSEILIETKDGTQYKVDCSVIYNNPVSYEITSDLIGYIRIDNFDAGCGEATKEAIDNLISQGAKSLCFDVRDNPGGMVSELITVLDYILPEGDIFVSVDGSGKETVTQSDNVCLQMQMAVIVNENTYSAAEYFAAALQEYGWATIIGAPTTGKSRSQTTVVLSDGSAVHISNHKYLTPKRVDLADQGGITPDVVVSDTTMNTTDGISEDDTVQKAIAVLNGTDALSTSDSDAA